MPAWSLHFVVNSNQNGLLSFTPLTPVADADSPLRHPRPIGEALLSPTSYITQLFSSSVLSPPHSSAADGNLKGLRLLRGELGRDLLIKWQSVLGRARVFRVGVFA